MCSRRGTPSDAHEDWLVYDSLGIARQISKQRTCIGTCVYLGTMSEEENKRYQIGQEVLRETRF